MLFTDTLGNLKQTIISFYDNGIYYPNVFLATLVLSIVLLAIVIGLGFKVVLPKVISYSKSSYKKVRYQKWSEVISQIDPRKRRARGILSYISKLEFIGFKVVGLIIAAGQLFVEGAYRFLNKDKLFIFIVLLFLTVFTRFFIAYSDPNSIIAPEKIFQVVPLGVDFYTAVFTPAMKIMNGKFFYDVIAIYGPAFSLFILPFHFIATSLNLCEPISYQSCSHLLYEWLLIATVGGYIFFIFLITRYRKKESYILLLFLVSFLLGIPGSLGLERGNIDISLSLISGLLLFLLLASRKYPILIKIIFTGIISGFIVNSKLFLVPFAVIAILTSRNILFSFLISICTFLILTYLPNIFGAPSNLTNIFQSAFVFSKESPVVPFVGAGLPYNHSFSAIGTLATDCVFKQTCDTFKEDTVRISLVSFILFFATFILPFITTSFIAKKIYKLKFTFWSLTIKAPLFIYNAREDKRFILFLFILADALVNLIPRLSFDYRLYFSLPILFLLWKESRVNDKARFYCYLSMIFLIIKGLWIFTIINPKGMNLLEPRGMSLFVVLHFYFLIKAGIELLYNNGLLFLVSRKK